MNWLKQKVKNWLGITMLEEENKKLLQRLDRLSDKQYRIEIKALHCEEQVRALACNFNVSLDCGLRDHHNWAVFSIKGKTDYVKFIKLDAQDLRDLREIVRKFENTNLVMDAPSGIKEIFYKI